ncbi:hypothetical protein FACS1894206_09580 [Deltaproteobacteria bacterium]|nr:hypothetical protein FACS1894206_09580 [Deltaproteobacteria bacterium]
MARLRAKICCPGDLLMVMPYYDSKSFQIVKDIMGILYQIAVATKVVVSM